jgi:hypothetical protein
MPQPNGAFNRLYPGGQKIDAERGTVERDSAEMLYGIDDQKKTRSSAS